MSVPAVTTTGLERARPGFAGRSPAYTLFGVVLESADYGSSRLHMDLDARMTDGARLAAGALGMLADASLGNAALTVMGVGEASNTSAMRVDLARLPDASGRIEGEGRVVGSDGLTVLVRGELRDASGDIFAVTTGRCFAVPAAYTPAGEPLPPDAAFVPIDPARPPVESLLGLRQRRSGPGEAVLAYDPPPPHRNIFNAVHGGLVAAVLEHACACAAAHGDAGPLPVRALDVAVRYLRPVPATGTGFRVIARSTHRTRRQAVVEAAIAAGPDAGSKMLATAQATYLLADAASDDGKGGT